MKIMHTCDLMVFDSKVVDTIAVSTKTATVQFMPPLNSFTIQG